MTYKQLQELSATRGAINGRYYQCDNGDIYKGTSDGRLILDTKSVDVVLKDNKTNLQEYIDTPIVEVKKNTSINPMLLMGG